MIEKRAHARALRGEDAKEEKRTGVLLCAFAP
jgi:hypothetical protein